MQAEWINTYKEHTQLWAAATDQAIEDAKKGGATLGFDPADMISLISAGAPALAQLRALAAKPGATLALADLRLHSPIPKPQRSSAAASACAVREGGGTKQGRASWASGR